MRRIIFTPP